MEKEIRFLRDFLQGEESLAKFEPVLRDDFLRNFIFGKKGDLEKAQTALENYLQVRTQTYPDVLLTTLPIRTRLSDVKHYRLLSNTDKDGNLICLVRYSRWEVLPDLKETADEWIRELSSYSDTLMHVKNAQCETGIVGIFDIRGYTYDHVKIMTLSNLKRAMSFALAYPIRLKAAHFIMDSVVMKSILSLMVSWMPKKISKRVKFHRDFDSVMEHISPSLLPKEMGGELEDEECYDMEVVGKIVEMEDYFREFSKVVGAKGSTA